MKGEYLRSSYRGVKSKFIIDLLRLKEKRSSRRIVFRAGFAAIFLEPTVAKSRTSLHYFGTVAISVGARSLLFASLGTIKMSATCTALLSQRINVSKLNVTTLAAATSQLIAARTQVFACHVNNTSTLRVLHEVVFVHSTLHGEKSIVLSTQPGRIRFING